MCVCTYMCVTVGVWVYAHVCMCVHVYEGMWACCARSFFMCLCVGMCVCMRICATMCILWVYVLCLCNVCVELKVSIISLRYPCLNLTIIFHSSSISTIHIKFQEDRSLGKTLLASLSLIFLLTYVGICRLSRDSRSS